MKCRIMWCCILTAFVVALSSSPLWACTFFTVSAKDGSVAVGRTLEFGVDPGSQLIYAPRGEKHSTALPDGKTGLSWTSKYASLYLSGFELDSPLDGMNEAGLAVAGLYMPGYAEYQKPGSGPNDKTISSIDLSKWILQSFSSVEEIRKTLPGITVYGAEVSAMGEVMPAHYVVCDAAGKGLVIEYTEGKLYMYDNPLGVLTNAPNFPWHMTNLKNYVTLSPVGAISMSLKDVEFQRTSQGSGLFGIPGDYTSPSRFVRAAIMSSWGKGATDADSAVILALHILNALDIPDGIAGSDKDGKTYFDYTRWSTIRDLAKARYFYRTYDNPSLRMVDLKQLAKGSKRKVFDIASDSTSPWTDMTNR